MPDIDNYDSNPNIEPDSLVDRAVGGDAEAFGQLYDMYADRIYRHIFYRISNKEDAKDLTQEIFLKAWKALPKYKKTGTPLLGWLFTISHNRIIDYYRTKKDHVNIDDKIVIEDRQKRPEELLEDQYTQQDIRRAILRLPEIQQQAILMSYIEGLEYSEIAATLKKSEGNIRVIIHRALKQMRDILGKVKE